MPEVYVDVPVMEWIVSVAKNLGATRMKIWGVALENGYDLNIQLRVPRDKLESLLDVATGKVKYSDKTIIMKTPSGMEEKKVKVAPLELHVSPGTGDFTLDMMVTVRKGK
jgi:hypothetical protein